MKKKNAEELDLHSMVICMEKGKTYDEFVVGNDFMEKSDKNW